MSVKISRSLVTLAAATLSLCAVQTASAALAIIDFNDKTNTAQLSLASSADTNNFNYVSYGTSYSSHGFTFKNSHDSNDAFLSWSSNSLFNADHNGATLAVNYGHTSTTISQNTGSLFNLRSLDLADVYNGLGETSGGKVRLDFTTLAGTTSEIINLTTSSGLHTFMLNKNNLLSFSVTGIDTQGEGWLQMDNVKVFGAGVAGTVPEAATWLMMLTGFAGVAGALRRREQLVLAA